ncbi:hypothetical protein EMUR_01785 [Ehrlichia muris AS145]|uniref:Uncharacterized protein n=1 Tax=Ehrlichia muris AS145 TaxID=1423892 RepID=V9R9Z3_9RICK|nr:hypothetical protein EMUR_01785 [Ehrlichia muris AS145]
MHFKLFCSDSNSFAIDWFSSPSNQIASVILIKS